MTSPPAPSRRSTLVLIACLVFGAALRFWTIGKDIPFGVAIDEPDLTRRAVDMMKTGSLNPGGFFDYPTLAIYVQFVVVVARFLAGTLAGEWRSLTQVSADDFYLWVRATTAMMGVFTIYVVYRMASRWGARAAMIAAAVMAVQPWHVRESHLALTDVPMTLCVALTMLASLRASEEGRLRSFAIAGAAAGLAAATKYNGLFVIIMPLTAAALRPPSRRMAFILATLGGAAAAFLIGAPYTILDLPGFLNGFADLSQHFNRGGLAWSDAAAVYIKHFRQTYMGTQGWAAHERMAASVSWLAVALCAAGLAILPWRTRRSAERPAALGALLFGVAYFWFIAHSSGQIFARYALPLVPLTCLGFGIAAAATLDALARRVKRVGLRRSASAVVLVLAIVPPLVQSASWDREQSKVSTGRMAMDWIEAHIRPTDRIVIETNSFRLSPPRFQSENVDRLINRSIDAYRADGKVYLVAIGGEFNRYDPRAHPAEFAAYEALFRGTEEVGRFTPGPHKEHPGSEMRILKIPR